MPTASLIKFPVMLEAYRQAAAGKLDLDSMVTLREEDKVPGSGILTDHFSAGLQLSLRDAIRLMIRYSDNTATNLVVDQIGLPSTAETMADWGFPETQLHSKVFRRDTSINLERSQRFGLGSTTAADMVELLTGLLAKAKGDSAAQEMLDHLLTCDDSSRFPRFLPPGTRVAHKTGAVTRSRTAAGIIFAPAANIVLCVLTDENADVSWDDDNAGHRLCADIAKALFDLAGSGPKPTEESATQAMGVGATGELVEALQRTLNDRIGADLGVDGDFGPATQAAVAAFQKSKNLDATGTVDESTWQALGELITEDEPVPSPEEVNSQTLPLAPPLDPEAPPAVTAKAFAILDSITGQVIQHLSGDVPLPNASTTKLMTAYVVLEYCEKHPSALNEIITFSERADNTLGSTSGIRAGEQVSVSELMYGLLLPSGNDASVALAEHFGARVAGAGAEVQSAADGQANYELFIATMNSTAERLGMSHSHFCNPHGLTEEGHECSAIDLGKLAIEAMKLQRLREIVSTRQRGCTLGSQQGYERNVLWKNTNRLLAQEGFFGIKTGTTEAAGACLIAAGDGFGKSRVVVVLGAVTSDARYVDARNLFQWAYRQE